MKKSTRKPRQRARPIAAAPPSIAGRVRWLLLLAILAAALSAGAFWLWRDFQQFTQTALGPSAQEQQVELRAGEGLSQLHSRMQRAGVAVGPLWRWRLLAQQLQVERQLKPGEYALRARLTPTDLLRAVADGKVVLYRFTIEPGKRFADFRQRIANDPVLKQTVAHLDDTELLARIGASEAHPEGLFLPETYFFARGYTDIEMYQRAYWAMQEALQRAFAERQPDLPLQTPYEALILASIIEKETGVAAERPEIAGVFVRRLRLGMRLQTDPTVIYGMGDSYDGNIRRSDLTTDTPYNTYTRYGLTPTPIALPSVAAIRAALNPADGDTLYFVAKGDGSHQFSATLAEHNAAVRRYQLGQP